MTRKQEIVRKVKEFVVSDRFQQEHMFEVYTDEKREVILKQVNQMLTDCGYSEFAVDNFTLGKDNSLVFHLKEATENV